MNRNLIERIALHADIDTRRALGIYKKLPKSDFVFRPIPPTTYRYFKKTKKLVFINFDEEYDVFMWDTYEDLEPDPVDPGFGTKWVAGPNARLRGVWHALDDYMYYDKPVSSLFPVQFAGKPEIIPE